MTLKKTSISLIIAVIFVLLGVLNYLMVNNVEASAIATPPPVLEMSVDTHKDANIDEASPNTALGTSTNIVMGKIGSDDKWGLFDFDTSALPADAVIITATMQVHVDINFVLSPMEPEAGTFLIPRAINAPWVENTVTWNTRPTTVTKGDLGVEIPPGTNGWQYWDVTNIVTSWVEGSQTQYGISLIPAIDSDTSQSFFAREAVLNSAKLVVYYTTLTPTNTPTSTHTNTPEPTSPCPGTVYVYADKDMYTDNTKPFENFGAATELKLHRDLADGTNKNVFFHFPIEDYFLPSDQIYHASLEWRESNAPTGISPAPYSVMVYTLNAPFSETGTTWDNQPGYYMISGSTEVVSGYDNNRRIEKLRTIVNALHTGTVPNHGIGLTMLEEDLSLYLHSREAVSQNDRPFLKIECGHQTITPFPPTDTPTVTPTPTQTPIPQEDTVNFEALSLRVIQSVQGYDNDVPLIEGRKTFVLFPVEVTDTDQEEFEKYYITAELEITRDGSHVATLAPINNSSGYLNLPIDPRYLFNPNINHVFLFEIPSYDQFDTLDLEAKVNPGEEYPETTTWDNDSEAQITFEPYRRVVGIKVFRIRDEELEQIDFPTIPDVNKSVEYAEQVLPFSASTYEIDILELPPDGYFFGKYEWTNLVLGYYYGQDRDADTELFQQHSFVRYYGLFKDVDATGGLVSGGLAAGIPSTVATGHTGKYTTFAHELGHTFDRFHSECCDAAIPCVNTGLFGEQCWYDGWFTDYEDYPYSPNCIIGGGDNYNYSVKYLGFQYAPYKKIISTFAQDLMGYCGPRWMSDFTWGYIMDYIGTNTAQTAIEVLQPEAAVEYLYIAGELEVETGEVGLLPIFKMLDSKPIKPGPRGDYTIVLRDSRNNELVRHEFIPNLPHGDTCAPNGEIEEHNALIMEYVPYDAKTAFVEVEGPSGLLKRVDVVSAEPSVRLNYPNGGELITSDTITVTWSASDPDKDALTYSLHYSPDNGVTWETLGAYLTEKSARVETTNLRASSRGLIKVIATDGFNTVSDESNSTFRVPNHAPMAEIIEPVNPSVGLVGQTISFRGWVFDYDDGTSDATQVEWYSNLEGLLGTGEELSLTGLSVGVHTILLTVLDKDGAIAADKTQISIYATADDLPTLPDQLTAGPTMFVFYKTNQGIDLDNANNPENPIAWTASSDESWLKLSNSSGSTPGTLALSYEPSEVGNQHLDAIVTITNTATMETIEIEAYVFPAKQIFLPIVR